MIQPSRECHLELLDAMQYSLLGQEKIPTLRMQTGSLLRAGAFQLSLIRRNASLEVANQAAVGWFNVPSWISPFAWDPVTSLLGYRHNPDLHSQLKISSAEE